jgi:hypothetical protein
MGRIGLIDVDGHHFPNLALMKLSSFHKINGDNVEWYNGLDYYDRVYMSKVFSFSTNENRVIQANEVIKGGTGYDVKQKLPEDIENIDPDYTLYPMHKFSLQLFSRGCVRRCPFCIVSEKEGKLRPVKPMSLNQDGNYIEVLDNNFFANPLWREAVNYLNSTRQKINLHGVDVRLIDEEQATALNSMKLANHAIHIAWDNPRENILPKLKEMVKYVGRHKITCYVLIGYWSDIDEDYHRVIELKNIGVDPFVMPYRGIANERPSQYEKDFAGWVNKKEIFNSCDFKDFSPRKGFKCDYYLVGNYKL